MSQPSLFGPANFVLSLRPKLRFRPGASADASPFANKQAIYAEKAKRRQCAQSRRSRTPLRWLAAVEYIVPEILHFQDCSIRPARERFVEMRFDHLSHHNMVIALLDHGGHATLDHAGRIGENRRTRLPLAE
jgi:hypothetical protein